MDGQHAARPQGMSPREPGSRREVVLVIVLTVVTLGIYGYIWSWLTSRELDRFTGRSESHGLVRAWVILQATSLVLVILAVIVLVAMLVAGVIAEDASGPSEEALMSLLLGPFLAVGIMFLVAMLTGLVGQVLAYVAFWRIWTRVEAEERSRGVPTPLQPLLHLGIWLGAMLIGWALSALTLIPFIGLAFSLLSMLVTPLLTAAQLFSLGRLQWHLNRLWQTAAPVATPAPAPAVG